MSANLRGVLWMAGTVLSFCAMAIAARQLLRISEEEALDLLLRPRADAP